MIDLISHRKVDMDDVNNNYESDSSESQSRRPGDVDESIYIEDEEMDPKITVSKKRKSTRRVIGEDEDEEESGDGDNEGDSDEEEVGRRPGSRWKLRKRRRTEDHDMETEVGERRRYHRFVEENEELFSSSSPSPAPEDPDDEEDDVGGRIQEIERTSRVIEDTDNRPTDVTIIDWHRTDQAQTKHSTSHTLSGFAACSFSWYVSFQRVQRCNPSV